MCNAGYGARWIVAQCTAARATAATRRQLAPGRSGAILEPGLGRDTPLSAALAMSYRRSPWLLSAGDAGPGRYRPVARIRQR